ncbi:hypothetical protein ACJX0J_039540, partial [Zea mays]
ERFNGIYVVLPTSGTLQACLKICLPLIWLGLNQALYAVQPLDPTHYAIWGGTRW